MITGFNLLNPVLGMILPYKDAYSFVSNYNIDIFKGFLPETTIIITLIMLCFISFLVKPKDRKDAVVFTSVIGLFLAILAIFYSFVNITAVSPVIFSGMFTSDALSLVLRFLMLVCTLFVVAFSVTYLEKEYRFEAEFLPFG